jgi:hypothetical protein
MPDQQAGPPAPPEADGPNGAGTGTPAKQDQPFGDLSEAARGVVHEPADPRLEKHLARIGLAEGDPSRPPRSSATSESGLLEQLARVEVSLAIANWRLQIILWLVVVLAGVVAVLAAIVITR